ncbi:MAG: hypothetical protein ABJE95_26840 [Byssovorax sp.]
MIEEIDATLYARPPKVDVASAVTLGRSLLTAMPKPAPEHVRSAATRLRKDTVALQAAWGSFGTATPPRDRRQADIRIDNAWGILLDRLVSYSRLPTDTHPRAARAGELVEIISPGDREWLKLAYDAEWAQSEKRLGWITDQGLTKDINELAGPEFLVEVQAAHVAYGVALAVTVAAPVALDVTLAEPLRTLSRSIGRYGLALVTMAGDDEASITVARNALRPIDAYREGQARRARGGAAGAAEPDPAAVAAPDAPVGPTTPIPEVK